MVLIFAHDDFLDHDTGQGHPERPDRLRAVYQRLKQDDFAELVWREPAVADPSLTHLAHDPAYVDRVLAAIPDYDLAYLDGDTVVSPESGQAALRAVGAVVDAVDQVLEGDTRRVFCAIRPPGHHAEYDQAMGFCLFNNIAIAAKYAVEKRGLDRVAIVDFDVHHGNGTQHILEDDARIFFASTHESPLYPGTGQASEQGGHNNVLNIPLRSQTDGAEFRRVFQSELLPRLDAFKPQLMLISAGFDAHQDDPLATLRFQADDYAWATDQLITVAETYAEGRVVSTLEGGYNLTALADSVAAHVKSLLSQGVKPQ